MNQVNPKILILGPTKEDTHPPKMNVLADFRRFDCPWNLNRESNVRKLLWKNFGRGYYKVYSPGHAQRMKIYFEGELDKDPFREGKTLWR